MNVFSSIYNYKCPKCRKGDLFVAPFDFKDPLKMNKECAHCGQNFEPEPGYYFGAMFISYGWTVWTIMAIVGFCMLVLDWSVEQSFALVIFVSAITYFFIMRVSRSMYIHMDVRYDKDLAAKTNENQELKVVK